MQATNDKCKKKKNHLRASESNLIYDQVYTQENFHELLDEDL